MFSRLSFRNSRPGPRPVAIEVRCPERAEGRHIVGGVNEAAVVEMFKGYRKDFREMLYIIRDDNNNEINRRCAYTREHKLAAIDYTLNTWDRNPRTSQLQHIS